jgi:hypothetical protein
MTLFVHMPRRRYEVSDAYIMALTFIIFFSVTKIVMYFFKKNQHHNSNQETKIHNPRGGTKEIKISDDNELSSAILSCIANDESYIVKNQQIKNLIFHLAKEKLTQESLMITPNMIRFLAVNLISKDQTLMVKIGNVVVSSNNRVRLLTRFWGTAMIALVGAVFSGLPYAVFMGLVYFDLTTNCGYDCSAYFEHLPKDVPVAIYAEQSAGNLIIAGNNDDRQVEIYIPSSDKGIHTNIGEKSVTRKYYRSRKKAKEVQFSEFKKTDPVLSMFDNLVEPETPQKPCAADDVPNVLKNIDL